MKVSYSDGAAQESRILDLIRQGRDLTSSSLLASEHYDDWAVRYHLSPERSNLFRHLDFEGLDVLELGAGMGGASRFPAEHAKSFVAVEGTNNRMNALRQRLRDLKNWQGVVSNIQEYQTDRRFDVVCIIGVLEYAELYIDAPEGQSPFVEVLRKAVSLLKPGGQVALAIENRNGIKYWAGAPEDHTGAMFEGICGYRLGQSPRTFNRTRMLSYLKAAGLNCVEEFYPWPDYKIPHAVISKRFADRHPELAADIAEDAMIRETGPDGTFFPTSLAIHATAPGGLHSELANSFLFVAGTEPRSYAREKLLRRMYRDHEYAWHYSIRRKRPIRTVFRLDPANPNTPMVEKRPFDDQEHAPEEVSGSSYVVWRQEPPTPALIDPKVAHLLRKLAYYEDRETFEDEFCEFLRWGLEHWELDVDHLKPGAFDAVPSNAVLTEEGFRLFDLEWELDVPMRKSWYVMRCIFNVRDTASLFRDSTYSTLEEMYESLCRKLGLKPTLDEDMRREAMVQSDVFRRVTADEAYASYTKIMRSDQSVPAFPRNSESERLMRIEGTEKSALYDRIRQLKAENDALQGQLGKRAVKLALSMDGKLRKVKPLYRLLRRTGSRDSKKS